MATKVKFVGNPWDCRVRHEEYNLCAGMMPVLKQSKRNLSEEDIQELQPILDHIKDYLCASNQQDYTNLLAWLAHIMQDPAEKTGWCPVISHHLHTMMHMGVLLIVEAEIHLTRF